MKKTWIIILAVVVVLGFLIFGFYNKMVTANEAVDGQWAQVETQYQRRFDLIPNLVESVKGVMAQEQAVFGAIAEARTRYTGATTVSEKAAAAGEVETALGRLLAVIENYPELKSAENVQTLMVQLEGTENRISVERKRFNDLARDFNVLIKKVPNRFFAGMFGFNEKAYFEAEETADVAPSVNF